MNLQEPRAGLDFDSQIRTYGQNAIHMSARSCLITDEVKALGESTSLCLTSFKIIYAYMYN